MDMGYHRLVDLKSVVVVALNIAAFVSMAAPATAASRPTITGTAPLNGQTNVFRDTAVTADVDLPHGGAGVDTLTLSDDTVKLTRTSDGAKVAGTVSTSGGGDAIVFQPVLLNSGTRYTFTVTSEVKDQSGSRFVPYTMSFTTGMSRNVQPTPGVNFSRTTVFTDVGLASLVIGPNNMLYATSVNGNLYRWPIKPDGTLVNPPQIYPGLAGRTAIGIAFDPLIPSRLWVSHNASLFSQPADDFTGAISHLTLSIDASTFDGILTPYVVGLPRSAKDHVTNSLAFGPDGFLYVTQGSNSAMGAPDATWYNRPERLLSAAVLRINPNRPGWLFNVQTEEYVRADGTTTSHDYDPTGPNAPVKIYASGLRNTYDMVWHTNGFLYLPTNGSAAGGNTPASPPDRVPAVPALNDVATQNDFLFKVTPGLGGYFGHPNPLRDEYVLNGGNPTSGLDAAEVVAKGTHPGYPVGTEPEETYKGFIYNFGRNRSPDGAIEYKSDTFSGALKNQLLVTEYSGGSDILAINLDSNGNLSSPSSVTQLASGFSNPLDLVEDIRNGNLYVIELINDGASGKITLLTPSSATPTPNSNTAPVANAGPDRTVPTPNASLSGSATDDGKPNPPGAMSFMWSKASGPGTVTFADATARNTTAQFSASGTYKLKFTASDSSLSGSDTVSIVVNKHPSVNAGADQTISLPDSARLTGSATDDGLPNPPAALTYTWSKVSGPGTVTFANPKARSTTASFSVKGTYTLKLTASDSGRIGSDKLIVTVQP